jgi:hypothetical protein
VSKDVGSGLCVSKDVGSGLDAAGAKLEAPIHQKLISKLIYSTVQGFL